MRSTRRELLGAGAAAGLALWLPAAARAAPKRLTVDVAVIGAGLAGLTAAYRLHQIGHSVAVVEAQDRVGGRTLTRDLGGGHVIDLGGESIGPTQDRITALAGELGLDVFETQSNASSQLLLGHRVAFPADGTPSDADYTAATAALAKLDGLAAGIPVDDPWNAGRAASWARTSLASFRDSNLDGDTARGFFDLVIRVALGADPERLSLLPVLALVAGAGNPGTPGSISRLATTISGQDSDRIVGGAQGVAEAIAGSFGGRVFLNAPARSVTRVRNVVTVDAGRVHVRARRVVVAIPPRLVPKLSFVPRLPAAKAQVLSAFRGGTLRKWQAIYPAPFWRDAQLSGQVFSLAGPAQVVFDNSPLEGTPGVLAGFAGGSAAAKVTKAQLLAGLTQAFGPAAGAPAAFVEQAWTSDRWSGGSPMSLLPGDAMVNRGPALRVPYGLVHFCGAEYASYWPGYMDGAVRSGEDCAQEVQLAFLRAATGY